MMRETKTLKYFMVGVKGLEPSTSRSQTARASQLRHTPIVCLQDIIIHYL